MSKCATCGNDYDKTFEAFGLRWKSRLSPRVGFSFPVSTRDKIFFNMERIGNTVSASIPIALRDAEPLEGVRELRHLVEHVGVGDGAGVSGFADPVVGNLVAAGLEVPVETVVGDVEGSVGEPLEEGSL